MAVDLAGEAWIERMIKATPIPGCFEVLPTVRPDRRGSLVKVFDQEISEALQLSPRWPEVFWSESTRGVVRGIHFQRPPAAVTKLVFCTAGVVFDAVVNLKRDGGFGATYTCTLSAEVGNALVVPEGCGHGFAVTAERATVCYLQSGPYDPAADAGIHWRSINVEWPVEESEAILSDRDAIHPSLDSFTPLTGHQRSLGWPLR